MLAYDLYTQSIRRFGAFFVLLCLSLNMATAQVSIDTVLYAGPTCNGFEDGEAQVFFSGGAGPYTITWSDGQEGEVAVGLAAGAYSVTVADDLGTESSASFEITDPDPITASGELTLPVCPDDSTGVISLTIQGGTPPYEIFWNNGDMGPVLSGVPPGNHFAFIIDALGCLLNQQFVLGNNDNVPPVIVAQSAVVPLNPVTGTVIMEPILFVSMVTDNCQIDGVNVAPLQKDCDDLGPNTINIAAIDNSGNITVVQVIATIVDITPPALAPENITVTLGTNGTVTVDPDLLSGASFDNCGIMALTLDDNTFDCSDIGENNVMLTAVDGSGNSSSAPAIITVVDNAPPTVVAQNITVELNANGQVVIAPSDLDGGSTDNCGILVLEASQTTFTCDDLASGDPIAVLLTLTDVNNNSASATALVTVVDPIAPVISCPDDLSGDFCQIFLYDLPTATDNCEVEITQTQGLGSGSVFQFGTTVETYVATDTYGNTATCSITITVNNDFDLGAEVNHVSCNGLANGSIVLNVSGGTPPYLYFWSPSGPDNLSSGIYMVNIFDNIGCETTQTFVVNEPEPLAVEILAILDATNGQSNGGFQLTVEGGTSPYSYEGASFDDTLSVSELAAGNYSFTLTDANGCSIDVSLMIDNINSSSEPHILQAFSLFPNPAKDFAMVDIQLQHAALTQVSLLDLTGRTLQSWPPSETDRQSLRIDLDGLAPGVYAVKLEVNGDTVVRKLILE